MCSAIAIFIDKPAFRQSFTIVRQLGTNKQGNRAHFASGTASIKMLEMMLRTFRLFRPILTYCFLFVMVFAAAGFPVPGKSFAQGSKKARLENGPSSNASPSNPLSSNASSPHGKEQPVPFHVGEVLDYKVSWSTFATAATARLSVPERRDLSGWQTWHFRANVNTVDPVRRLFTIDDEFDSYTDVHTFDSHQFEMYLDELGKKQTTIFHLAPMGAGERGPGPFVAVLPGTRDPVGVLYSLRAVEWRKTAEISAPVYDGHNLYEMRANRAGSEQIAVAAGTFQAMRVDIHIFDKGQEVSRIEFAVWISQDSHRLPVLMTAQLPFGSLRIEMTNASN